MREYELECSLSKHPFKAASDKIMMSTKREFWIKKQRCLYQEGPIKAEITLTLAPSIIATVRNKPEISTSLLKPQVQLQIIFRKTANDKTITFNTEFFSMSTCSETDANKMANVGDKIKGFFNDSASINFIPGGGDDVNDPRFPSDKWNYHGTAPTTSNPETKYTYITGYNLGIRGGANAGPTGGGVQGNVSANYSSSCQTEANIPTFAIRNTTQDGWYFYYTPLRDDGNEAWNHHFSGFHSTVKRIDDLASGRLPLQAECVYKGESDAEPELKFTLLFKPTYRLLHAPATYGKRCYSVTIDMRMKFAVNVDTLDVTIDQTFNPNP